MQVTELKALREDTPEPELPGEIGPTSSRSAAYYTTMGVTDLAFPEAAEKVNATDATEPSSRTRIRARTHIAVGRFQMMQCTDQLQYPFN